MVLLSTRPGSLRAQSIARPVYSEIFQVYSEWRRVYSDLARARRTHARVKNIKRLGLGVMAVSQRVLEDFDKDEIDIPDDKDRTATSVIVSKGIEL